MSDSPYRIERMSENDLPQVLAIEKASFPIPFSENLFRMELKLDVAHLYIVRVNSQATGYIDYWQIDPEMHIITIAVHPDWRAKGIGSALIQFLIEDARARKSELISLDVRPSNEAALKLYKKFGFKEAGRRKHYYQDNQEDALILSLTL